MKTAQELFNTTHPGHVWDNITDAHRQAWENWAARIKGGPQIVNDTQELVQAKALLMTGYRGNMSMGILVDPQLLGEDWGGPNPSAIANPVYGGIVLNLDAEYHSLQDPYFDDNDFTVNLAFVGVTTCVIPYRAIKRVIFNPVMPPEPDAA
jgi:hypothetical protein